jgi:HPt (histidine-containing phosphotransfer) domain-containing protein
MNIRVENIRQEINTSDGSDISDVFLQAMADINEINTEVGMCYVEGSREMYFCMFVFFHQHLVTDVERMSEYLRAGDMKAFIACVHGMRSVLATVGAEGLSETAFRLETASKSNDAEYCNEHCPAFVKNLLALHNKLSLILPEEK